LKANFISPKYPEDFSGFIDAVWERHGQLIGKLGETRVEHIKKTYLNHDPCHLGGRAAGLPGQSGSNNSGEKKNHTIKDYLKTITRFVSGDERKNVLFAMGACALDLHLEDDAATSFAFKPSRLLRDYDFLRFIDNQARNDAGQLLMEVQYMACTNQYNRTEVLDTRQVIGNQNATFTAHIPTASNIYTQVARIEKSRQSAVSSASFFEQNRNPLEAEGPSTHTQCMEVLSSYSLQQKKLLMKVLDTSVMENKPGRKEGEMWEQFIHRRLQRFPLLATSTRSVARLKKKKQNIRRKKAPGKKELAARAKRDADKFGDLGKAVLDFMCVCQNDLILGIILIRPGRWSNSHRRWEVWVFG